MINTIMKNFNINNIENFMYENEIKILYAVLISILLSYIALFITKWFYLKNIKNKAFQIDETILKENDKLKELQNLIIFSRKISRVLFIVMAMSILFLSFDILNFIITQQDDRVELLVSGYVYYYIASIVSLIFFATLIIISIYLYYRYNKKHLKKYLKFDIILFILNIVLYIIGDILTYIR